MCTPCEQCTNTQPPPCRAACDMHRAGVQAALLAVMQCMVVRPAGTDW